MRSTRQQTLSGSLVVSPFLLLMLTAANGCPPFLLLLLVAANGCSGKPDDMLVGREETPTGCSDADHDGYGVGPECTGPDCNDAVASVHADADCESLCDAHPGFPGCACDPAGDVEPADCYTGAESTALVGTCRSGVTSCRDGAWGPCVGEVLPAAESCDQIDNDCNGEIDNGALSECGVCGECDDDCVGPAAEDCREWATAEVRNLVAGADGWLELPEDGHASNIAWPSSPLGETYRVNIDTLEVEGTYRMFPDWVVSSRYVQPYPGRIAQNGDLLVPTGEFETSEPDIFGGIAETTYVRVTRLAAEEGDCVDRNGNGRIDTSTGVDDRRPWLNETEWDDECVLWYSRIGDSGDYGSIGTSLGIHTVGALDGVEELGWIGTRISNVGGDRAIYYEFDVATGEPTDRTVDGGFDPAMAIVIDHDHWLWAGSGTVLIRFDTADPESTYETFDMPDCVLPCLAVDEANNVWLGMMPFPGLQRFNRARGELETLEFDRLALNLMADGHGSVWTVSVQADGGVGPQTLERFSVEDFELEESYGESSATALGVDANQLMWMFGPPSETMTLAAGDRQGVFPELDPAVHGFMGCSDLNGVRMDDTPGGRGSVSYAVEGCTEGTTEWGKMTVEAEVPLSTTLSASFRTADTIAAMGSADRIDLGLIEPGVAIDLSAALEAADVVDGRLLEIDLIVESPGDIGPRIGGIQVEWGCAVPVG